ncbi:hypothetical protein AGMMS49938_14850 [Fibrobacterales bacterium]|nr:hypothetical protein AGMMS49938_14850 [Fibrobacterales bacterium]
MQISVGQMVAQMLGEQVSQNSLEGQNSADTLQRQVKNTPENLAVQMDAERLKLINELSRLILELSKNFPELSQELSKARDSISENTTLNVEKQLKNIIDLLKLQPTTDLTQKLKNAVSDLIKILQPNASAEIPLENKLIIALSKNDFVTAANIIKEFVLGDPPSSSRSSETRLPPPQQLPQAAQSQSQSQNLEMRTAQNFQVLLNAVQELKELGIPPEFKGTPLKEFENFLLQKVGVGIPQNTVKNLLTLGFGEKPIFASVIQGTEQLPLRDSNIRVAANAENMRQSANIITGDFTQHPINRNENRQSINNEIAFSLYEIAKNPLSSNSQSAPLSSILLPYPASADFPKSEQNFWLKTELPLTPQTLNLRENLLSFGVPQEFFTLNDKSPEKQNENITTVRNFAEALHAFSLQTESGTATKEQANLLWRAVQNYTGQNSQTQQLQQLPQQIIQSLLKYQPLGNAEGDIFKSLPEHIKKEILNELPNGKALQPDILQKSVEKVLDKHLEQHLQNQTISTTPHKMSEEIHILQNLKEQIQWTRIDQDTRPANDRENVFYFMHNGEMQKGHLKIRDDRKGGGKKQQGSSIAFTIETKAKKLGQVRADLTLTKNTLTIKMQDELGTASEEVNAERETLAQELADIGITLGELIYGKTPKVKNLPIATTANKSKGSLDLKA